MNLTTFEFWSLILLILLLLVIVIKEEDKLSSENINIFSLSKAIDLIDLILGNSKMYSEWKSSEVLINSLLFLFKSPLKIFNTII